MISISEQELALKILQYRKREKLTQAQLCKLWKIGPNTIVSLEKGEKKLDDIEKRKYLAYMGENPISQMNYTAVTVDRILRTYDEQFIAMQNEFVRILVEIKNETNLEKIKQICDREIDIIKKDQKAGEELNNIYDMKGNLI